MSCEQTRLILHAYFDSELDAVRAAEFEGHLQDCAECMAALETQKLLRDAIHRRNNDLRQAGRLVSQSDFERRIQRAVGLTERISLLGSSKIFLNRVFRDTVRMWPSHGSARVDAMIKPREPSSLRVSWPRMMRGAT